MARTKPLTARPLAIAAGGACGATVRWAVVSATPASAQTLLPWPVLAINVVGSFVLGVLLAEEPGHPRQRLLLHDFGGIGFCGGLTTFSTFAVEMADLLRDDHVRTAAVYLALSVATTIAAVIAGAAAGRRVRDAVRPVEGEP